MLLLCWRLTIGDGPAWKGSGDCICLWRSYLGWRLGHHLAGDHQRPSSLPSCPTELLRSSERCSGKRQVPMQAAHPGRWRSPSHRPGRPRWHLAFFISLVQGVNLSLASKTHICFAAQLSQQFTCCSAITTVHLCEKCIMTPYFLVSQKWDIHGWTQGPTAQAYWQELGPSGPLFPCTAQSL